jgi:cytochrome c-type biogenesis protein
MTEPTLLTLVVLPIGLGLLGFVEPCSIGSTLLFIKYLEGKPAARKLAEAVAFAATRALALGLLGVVAAFLGAAFLGLQKGAWILLGLFYVAIGALAVTGRARVLTIPWRRGLARLSGLRGSAGLGLLFGINVPACAAPLVFVMLGTAAVGGVAGRTLATGFVSLALFGLALSLPLVLAVLCRPARSGLDWLAGLSGRLPGWTGGLLIAVGLWSIGFALFARVTP